MSEIHKQPEEIYIDQTLLDQISNHVRSIPATSPAYLADESTAEKLGIDQLDEKQATAVFEYLQEKGIVAKTYTKNKGYLTAEHDDNKPEQINLATRLRRNKLGRTMLMPLVDQSVQYFQHNTASRPKRYIIDPAKKYSGRDLVKRKLNERNSDKDEKNELIENWQANRTFRLNVNQVPVEPKDTDNPEKLFNIAEQDHRELWQQFKDEVSKRVVAEHPGSGERFDDMNERIRQETLNSLQMVLTAEQYHSLVNSFEQFEKDSRDK